MANVKLADIALRAGVHVSTASRALDHTKEDLVSLETRQRVLAAASELGYRRDVIASGLRSGRTGTIGIVVPDLSNPFYGPVIRGVENTLDDREMMALVAETRSKGKHFNRVLDHLRQRRVDAIVMTAARAGDQEVLLEAARHVPIVLAVRQLEGSGLPHVAHDGEQGGAIAAKHLLAHGHERLAVLRGPSFVSSFEERTRGFTAQVRAAGLEPIPFEEEAAASTVEEGARLSEIMLKDPLMRPTALFAHNDEMAIGALQSIRDLGLRCPDDISVVGYDDARFAAHANPPLTTLHLPAYRIGRLAAEMALAVVFDDHMGPASIIIKPEIVVRDSTAQVAGTAGRQRGPQVGR